MDLAVEVSKISNAEMQRRSDAHNRIEGQFPLPESDAIFEAFVRADIEQFEILPPLRALYCQA